MSDSASRLSPSRAQWLRRLALRRRGRTALVLSGGGPLGAIQVGAVRALFEQGITPDIIVGTSVGALNGAFIAFDPTSSGLSNLETSWRSMVDADMFPGGRWKAAWAKFFVKGDHAFDNTGIRRLIDERIGPGPIEAAAIPLGIVATELDTGAEQVFTSGSLADALLASTAMPGIYPPVTIGGIPYIDGGVSNNVPVAPAIAMGATTIYVVNTTSQGSQQRRPLTRPIDYLLHAFTLARSQRLAVEQAIYADKVKLVMIPSPKMEAYVPFASLSFTDQLISRGYETATRFLTGVDAAVVSTFNEGALEAIAPAK